MRMMDMGKALLISLCAVSAAGCAGNTYNLALYNKDVGTTSTATVPTTVAGNRAAAHKPSPTAPLYRKEDRDQLDELVSRTSR